MAKQELSTGGTEGCVARGLTQNVIFPAAATRTLTAAESGSLVMLDTATQTITLPVPVAGLTFTFRNSIISVAQKVLTDSASSFLLGRINSVTLVAGAGNAFDANGTTHRSIATNGSTTGGLIGDNFTVTAINGTQWMIGGTLAGSGTVLTPIGTS